MAREPVIQAPEARHALTRLAPLPPSSSEEAPGVTLAPRPFLGKISLRGDATTTDFTAAVTAVLGLALPRTPNRTARSALATALWLGPDHWLLVTAPGDETALCATLRAGLRSTVAAIVDVSDQLMTLTLGGARARDVLAKGCALDLDARAFPPGRVARTVLARVPVVLHFPKGGDGCGFDLHVEASHAEFLWHWLADAAREYGCAETGAD